MTITDTTGATLARENELARRLELLSLEQKVALLTGATYWTLWAEPAVGLRVLKLSDGPVGVRGERWDERDPSANIPTTISVAATWDVAAARELGLLLGNEAIRKSVDVFLAPAVNLFRSPLGGRTFENFSEDPMLTGSMGAALVRGVQAQGVAATVKHFVANDSETDRYTVDARVDERTLRELYLAPFKEIVDAGVWAVMAAYNLVNGEVMTESRLLTDVLRDEWGFDGVVMSDWFAVRSVEASANSGLDLAMPGPISPWSEGLLDAARDGRVPLSEIDEKVLRLLRLAARVGALEGVAPEVATPERVFTKDEQRELLTRTASDGMVLLKNISADGLPLAASQLRSVAVLGPAAARPRTLGGGSATVYPEEVITPLEAIRASFGEGVTISHLEAVQIATRHGLAEWSDFSTPEGEGLWVAYLDRDGNEIDGELRQASLLKWLGDFMPGVPRASVTSVRVSGKFRASTSGTYQFGASGVGQVRLRVGSEQLINTRLALPAGTDPIEAQIRPPQLVVPVQLSEGQEVDVVLEHDVMHERPTTKMELNVDKPQPDEDAEIARAVEAARSADVALIFVGTTAEIETESMDRPHLTLPGRQDELVERVAEVNPRTIVVINAGAPVLTSWADRVASVLVSWFAGERFGPAVADVLRGEREPGGRLPISWPAREIEAILTTTPRDGKLPYEEKLGIGYRSAARRANEQFPFGHGLGYTSWEVGTAGTTTTASGWTIEIPVRNVGARRGKHVVQVYAEALNDECGRPARWLVGFDVAVLDPDESTLVSVVVPRSRLSSYLNDEWIVPSGEYILHVGTSIDNASSSVTVQA